MNWLIKSKLDYKLPPTNRLSAILQTVFGDRNLPNSDITSGSVLEVLSDLNQKELKKAVLIINKAIKAKKPILIYGDYDCDGVCATAILWETLHQLGANVLPFIPHRLDHGYGLSEKGIEAARSLFPDQKPLIITVDNGIRAEKIAESLQKEGIDLIITDHHIADVMPKASAIVHSTQICGAGVAWVLASQFMPQVSIDLVALATICDQMPLIGLNRLFVIAGLKELRSVTRIGLESLYELSQITDPSTLNTYHLGFVIGPRLNAAGRLGNALAALRLLCTKNSQKAAEYAQNLNDQNQTRQELTADYFEQALNYFKKLKSLPNLLFYAHPNIPEGILGLIAGKLTETFARPAIVLNTGSSQVKGSARSLNSLDITAILNQASEYLLDFGGHQLAAGLTTTSDKVEALEKKLLEISANFDPTVFVKNLEIEMELLESDLQMSLVDSLEKFSPFGLGNQEPIFAATFTNNQYRIVGQTQKHLKLNLKNADQNFSAIGFNMAHRVAEINQNQPVQYAFTLEKNTYLGKTSLQLKIKDFRCV